MLRGRREEVGWHGGLMLNRVSSGGIIIDQTFWHVVRIKGRTTTSDKSRST